MTARKLVVFVMAAAIAGAAVGCDRGSNNPTGYATATAGSPSSTGTTTSTTPNTAVAAPTTDAVAAAVGQRLRPLALQPADAPAGFAVQNDQPFSKKQATAADISVPPLAIFLDKSDLSGGLARLFKQQEPASALSSVVYLFATPDSAKGFVAAIAALTSADYFGASAVDRVQSDKIGDAAQMMRYETAEGRTLEYTWAQGRLAGQLVLRGGVDSPDDVAQLISLARKQSERMAASAP